MALWALQEPGAQSGHYNVGSGAARTFLDKAKIMFAEMGVEPNVEFIDLPPHCGANINITHMKASISCAGQVRAAVDQPRGRLESSMSKTTLKRVVATNEFC